MTSIRLRLLLVLLGMLALAAAAMGLITYRNVLAETESLFDYQLRQMALSLRDQNEIAPDQAGVLADEQLDFVIQIWTADGRTIYASRRHSELPARAQLGFADIEAGGEAWRTFGVATGLRVIQVAQPLRIRRALAADAALRSAAPLALLALPMALVAWWLAALTLRPLARVAAEMRTRDAQSLAPVPLHGLPDELAPLVAALNALLERLALSLDAQRDFVADAAHELRSPLTALKLQLRLLERAADDAARRDAQAALAASVGRAAWLVEQLLALARSEPGAPPLPMESVDLAATVRAALAATAPHAHSRGVEIELHADAPVAVRGNAAALTALARNLADNAVRHGPRGARVEVRVEAGAGRPTLVVDDTGPGIAPAERARVFDRFHRRAGTDSEAEGSGLGLAIVRSVADRHGAAVELGDSPQGGLRVTVRFASAAA